MIVNYSVGDGENQRPRIFKILVAQTEKDSAIEENGLNGRTTTAAFRDGATGDNYRARVLKPLAEELGLPKLNFQVLRRTMATLAQTKGSVKDVQAILGHSKADTTVNVYMQSIEASVKQTQEAITPS